MKLQKLPDIANAADPSGRQGAGSKTSPLQKNLLLWEWTSAAYPEKAFRNKVKWRFSWLLGCYRCYMCQEYTWWEVGHLCDWVSGEGITSQVLKNGEVVFESETN